MPPGPVDANAATPPTDHLRRHSRTDFSDTRNPAAISAVNLARANISAARSRTACRRTRAARSIPPPAGYLITPTYPPSTRIKPTDVELPTSVASVLPAITTPRFDARELIAHRSARLGHLAYSTIMLAAPLAVLPVWYWVITTRHPDTQFPPLHGLIGNVVVFTSIGAILCLVLGPLVATVTTPSLFALLVVTQQALPESLLSTTFSTGRSWHSNYWVTTAAALLALVLSWRLRAVPWPNRP